MTPPLRCRALLVVATLFFSGNLPSIDAFSSRIPLTPTSVTLNQRSTQTRLYNTATTASSTEDDGDLSSLKYQWTRPTLDIAVPALIGMMAGE